MKTLYGLSLEFPKFYFQSKTPLQTSEPLFTIANNDVEYFKVYGLDGLQLESPGDIHYVLSATSTLTNATPELNLFNPLTAFLQYISDQLNAHQNGLPLAPKTTWQLKYLSDTFSVNYTGTVPITLKESIVSQPLEQTNIVPQMTFGFNDVSILSAFYGHFDPVKYLNMDCKDHPTKATFVSNPYSDQAQALFTVMFQQFGMDDSWQKFFNAIEFLRLSLGFAMARDIGQATTNRLGNQAYMRILSSVTMRSLFQNITPQIFLSSTPIATHYPNIELPVGSTENVTFLDLLWQYIQLGFSEDFQKRIPFWHIASTPTIDDISYMQVDPNKGNPNLIQYYKDHASVMSILQSIFWQEWPTQGYPESLTEAQQVLYPKPSASIEAVLRQMHNNLDTYDFMSPVPFDCPDSPMGYHTRYALPDTPKVLLTVKYIEKMYAASENTTTGDNSDDESTACVYNDQFQNWCVQEFSLAQGAWTE